MRYELTIGDLVEAVQEHLDSDHRYFDQDCGVLDWDGGKVSYLRLADEYQLTYRGETITCVRF